MKEGRKGEEGSEVKQSRAGFRFAYLAIGFVFRFL